jgi:hypothetical protein
MCIEFILYSTKQSIQSILLKHDSFVPVRLRSTKNDVITMRPNQKKNLAHHPTLYLHNGRWNRMTANTHTWKFALYKPYSLQPTHVNKTCVIAKLTLHVIAHAPMYFTEATRLNPFLYPVWRLPTSQLSNIQPLSQTLYHQLYKYIPHYDKVPSVTALLFTLLDISKCLHF